MATTPGRLSRAQIVEIGKFMETIISKGDGDHVKYAADWNDDKIAAKFDVTLNAVKGLRTELFGNLQRGTQTFMEKVFAKIDALEARVAALEDQVTKPQHVANGTQRAGSYPPPFGR